MYLKSPLKPDDRLYFERLLWNQDYRYVMGLDEAGRGCLCGAVVAAGVIFKPGTVPNPEIRDSKTIPPGKRRELSQEIKETALCWTIQSCSPAEIDEYNILHASIRAMVRCTEKAAVNPDYLLVDGNRFTPTLIPHSCLIKGDDRSVSIAAASILAKVYRDDLMKTLHREYPYYGWDTNMGYPTKTHLEGLEKFGYTKYHRQSFKLPTNTPVSLPVDTE